MLNVKTHFTHTSVYLLTQTRIRTHTQTHTHSWPRHVWGRFRLLPYPLCGSKWSWVISLFIFTWRHSLIKCPTLRSGLSGTVPAVRTHGFNLHPGLPSALLQSTVSGQGPRAFLIRSEQRSQGVLTTLQGSLLALGLHLLSEDPCPTQGGEASPAMAAGSSKLIFLFSFQCWALLEIPEPLPGGGGVYTHPHACMYAHTCTHTRTQLLV